MKTIAVDEETWRKLRELKDRMGYQSFNEVINALVRKWHTSFARESIEKMGVEIDPEEVESFFKQLKRRRGST